MRKAQLFQQPDFMPAPASDGGRGPLAHAVNGENGRLGERRRVKRAGGVGLMVGGEEDGTVGAQAGQLFPDGLAQIEPFTEPVGEHGRERAPAARRDGEVGFEQACEFEDRLVVKNNRVELRGGQPGVLETKPAGLAREIRVVLPAREPFLLRGGGDDAVTEQGGGGIMVVGGDAENIPRRGHRLHERIQRPRDAGAGAENKNDPQQKQHDDQGDQPPLLFAGAKAQEFFEHRPHRPAQCSHPAGQCNSVELPVVVRFRF